LIGLSDSALGSPAVRRSATRRVVGIAASALGWLVLAVAVAALALVGVGPRLLGYHTETVLSGSMRPAFAPGDVVVVTPEPAADVRVGQIISYHIPVGDRHVETHRVIRIVSGGAHPVVVTRGDANGTPDPWQARLLGPQVWRERAVIPKLGYAIHALRQPWLQTATVIVAPALLALLVLGRIWRPRRPDEQPLEDRG
jgi:signal peptidase I